MTGDQLFWLCLVVAGIGLAVVFAIVRFGKSLFGGTAHDFFNLVQFIDFWKNQSIRPNLPRYFVEALSDSLQRRNEFWITYGQVIVATLIIVVLTILLITKTVSAEAGLPLLSAVAGFAIAKGVAAGSSAGPSGPDREQ